MKIGVISEGHSDRAVIANVLKGVIGIEISNIVPLRPYYATDETDKAIEDPRTKSSYSVIKEECESRELFDGFFLLEDQKYIIVHIDTAEADRYGIDRPLKKDVNYTEKLRDKVVKQIDDWLNNEDLEKVLHAVAVEEIDAWVLTIFEDENSERVIDAKKKLSRVLARKNVKFDHDPFRHYLSLSRPLSKRRYLEKGTYLKNNKSLMFFIEEIRAKIKEQDVN